MHHSVKAIALCFDCLLKVFVIQSSYHLQQVVLLDICSTISVLGFDCVQVPQEDCPLVLDSLELQCLNRINGQTASYPKSNTQRAHAHAEECSLTSSSSSVYSTSSNIRGLSIPLALAGCPGGRGLPDIAGRVPRPWRDEDLSASALVLMLGRDCKCGKVSRECETPLRKHVIVDCQIK